MGEMMGDFIDFADIINQINRREMNRIYEFNLMLVGTSGWGKSSLVYSLFQGMIKPDKLKVQKLNEYSELLEKNGVKLNLTCIETTKYYSHNNDEYVRFIEERLKAYFIAQRREASWNIKDTRVHCCLYLVPPYGELELRKEDIDCMRALHKQVNLVPIIAGADRFSSEEREEFKKNIRTDLESNGIDYYKFQKDVKEDEERFKSVKEEAKNFPFAIIAAKEPVQDGVKTRWIRTNGLGSGDINDSSKCDFDSLQKLLVRHCMLDLIDSTHVTHYANYKRKILEIARAQNCKNLKEMGLRAHEIKLIEDYIRPEAKKLADINRRNQREEMERELQRLRQTVQNLKNDLRNRHLKMACHIIAK